MSGLAQGPGWCDRSLPLLLRGYPDLGRQQRLARATLEDPNGLLGSSIELSSVYCAVAEELASIAGSKLLGPLPACSGSTPERHIAVGSDAAMSSSSRISVTFSRRRPTQAHRLLRNEGMEVAVGVDTVLSRCEVIIAVINIRKMAEPLPCP